MYVKGLNRRHISCHRIGLDMLSAYHLQQPTFLIAEFDILGKNKYGRLKPLYLFVFVLEVGSNAPMQACGPLMEVTVQHEVMSGSCLKNGGQALARGTCLRVRTTMVVCTCKIREARISSSFIPGL